MKTTSVRYFAAILLFTCNLTGCQWNAANEPISRDKIIGEWSLYQINDELVETDSSYCISFLGDGNGQLAICNPERQWCVYNRNFTFDEQTHLLYSKGECYYKECSALLRIDYVSEKIMRLTFKEGDGVSTKSGGNKIITLLRLEPLSREEIVGLWEGYEIDNENGRKIGENRRWEYFDDGRFNYYREKQGDKWLLKEDNNGHYYLCGDFLATNYYNDIASGIRGNACECWYVNINGNTMTWMAYRGGKTHRFRMDRVTEE
ncbi:MAG: hypothetical protein SOZ00_00540 [Tidjanibacter sp.]|nr:hypothetical protein [Tidjanibacter sp.]